MEHNISADRVGKAVPKNIGKFHDSDLQQCIDELFAALDSPLPPLDQRQASRRLFELIEGSDKSAGIQSL